MNIELGSPLVIATSGRGHSPEELAELATNRIIQVGQNSHPLVVEQAKAFREQIREILTGYFYKAQSEERATIKIKISENGFADLANVLDKL